MEGGKRNGTVAQRRDYVRVCLYRTTFMLYCHQHDTQRTYSVQSVKDTRRHSLVKGTNGGGKEDLIREWF